mmetsp:Transcript_18753/g.60611  ORF Transcript_18753/g.60611 Transcript_18753/m.60611 type:complete len:288 (+) Transcript_18753:1866-2729(+)
MGGGVSHGYFRALRRDLRAEAALGGTALEAPFAVVLADGEASGVRLLADPGTVLLGLVFLVEAGVAVALDQRSARLTGCAARLPGVGRRAAVLRTLGYPRAILVRHGPRGVIIAATDRTSSTCEPTGRGRRRDAVFADEIIVAALDGVLGDPRAVFVRLVALVPAIVVLAGGVSERVVVAPIVEPHQEPARPIVFVDDNAVVVPEQVDVACASVVADANVGALDRLVLSNSEPVIDFSRAVKGVGFRKLELSRMIGIGGFELVSDVHGGLPRAGFDVEARNHGASGP